MLLMVQFRLLCMLLLAAVGAPEPELETLARTCDGSHKHAPFASRQSGKGGVITSERRYPQRLCGKMARLVGEALNVKPLERSSFAAARQAAGQQVKRGPSNRVPEFAAYPMFDGCSLDEVRFLRKWMEDKRPKVQWRNLTLTKDHKLVSVADQGGELGHLVVIGIPWTTALIVDMKKSPSKVIRDLAEVYVVPEVISSF